MGHEYTRTSEFQGASLRQVDLGADWGEETHTVLEALTVVLNEHVEHLRFARRDLAALEARRSAPA